MARIGSIYLGGREGKPETKEIFLSGIAFFLEEDSRVSKLFSYDNDWEVEVSQGNQFIVARSKNSFLVDQILTIGFETCQRFLDLLSIEGKGRMNIYSPGENYVILYNEGEKVILRFFYTGNKRIPVPSSIQDEYRSKVLELPEKPVSWILAFRYYRLAQISKDLFEAYRYLYLGIEFLLKSICPKRKNEDERNWFVRALNAVNKKVSLLDLVPIGTSDPITYILETHYDKMCYKLFHTKEPVILPTENINPSEVSNTCRTLLGLWQVVANKFYNVSLSSEVLTYRGFDYMMGKVLEHGFYFYAEVDIHVSRKVSRKKGDLIDPFPYTKRHFMNNINEGEKNLGYALLSGMISEELNDIESINAVNLLIVDKIMFSVYIKEGLSPLGVDRMEMKEMVTLVYKS